MSKEKNLSKGLLIGFLAGGAIGAIIALLYAPKSGKELRKDIKDKADEYMGEVIGDLNSRRGKIQTMTQRTNVRVIAAMVPLSSMFGYATDLRSRTQGRATYTMQFAHYEEVPKNISEDIVLKVKGG